MPSEIVKYIHRAGRTARAGQEGTCFSILNDTELLEFKKMAKKTKLKIQAKKLQISEVKENVQKLKKLEHKISKKLDQEY